MQTTIARPARLEGTGLDNGAPVEMRVLPAPADTGIEFVRTDLPGDDNAIRAHNDSVREVRLRTVIANDAGHEVSLVEHAMGAFAAFGIDNLRVEVDGPELPFMDGSALPFAEKLRGAGRATVDGERKAIRILETVRVEMKDAWMELQPASAMELAMCINFPRQDVEEQRLDMKLTNGEAVEELVPARTFGTKEDETTLKSEGKLKGLQPHQVILVEGDKMKIPGGLRFKNECVRHKALDALGDLYLSGHHILGRCVGFRSGHRLTHRLVRKLLDTPAAWKYEVVPGTRDHVSVN